MEQIYNIYLMYSVILEVPALKYPFAKGKMTFSCMDTKIRFYCWLLFHTTAKRSCVSNGNMKVLFCSAHWNRCLGDVQGDRVVRLRKPRAVSTIV